MTAGILGMVENIIKTDSDLKCPKTPPATDTITCHHWEQEKFENFKEQYEKDPELSNTHNITPEEVFQWLGPLQQELGILADQTGQIFDMMNKWYEQSNVEDTDLLTPVGGNALLRISIIIQRTYVPFTFAASPSPSSGSAGGGSGGPPSGAAGAGTGGTGGAAATGAGATGAGATGGGGAGGAGQASGGSTTSPAHTAETVLVEVHRRAKFNIVGGAMVIRVPTKSFGVVPQVAPATAGGNNTTVYPASCNGGKSINIPAASGAPSTPYYCSAVTQTSDWQVAGMVGVGWFPFGRDYFPRGTSGSLHIRNMIPSLLVATSVTSLGSAFGGPNFEPVSGLDMFVGVASAHQTALPGSLPATTVLLPVGSSNGPPALPTVTHLKAGLTFGVGFDVGVFTQIFSKTSVPSLP